MSSNGSLGILRREFSRFFQSATIAILLKQSPVRLYSGKVHGTAVITAYNVLSDKRMTRVGLSGSMFAVKHNFKMMMRKTGIMP